MSCVERTILKLRMFCVVTCQIRIIVNQVITFYSGSKLFVRPIPLLNFIFALTRQAMSYICTIFRKHWRKNHTWTLLFQLISNSKMFIWVYLFVHGLWFVRSLSAWSAKASGVCVLSCIYISLWSAKNAYYQNETKPHFTCRNTLTKRNKFVFWGYSVGVWFATMFAKSCQNRNIIFWLFDLFASTWQHDISPTDNLINYVHERGRGCKNAAPTTMCWQIYVFEQLHLGREIPVTSTILMQIRDVQMFAFFQTNVDACPLLNKNR